MKRLLRIALAAILFAASAIPASSASVLRPVKKIGFGWNDKWGWMGFVSFSPDGTKVASDGPATPGDASGDLTVWSFPRGKLLKHLPGQPQAMSPDWRYYADKSGIRDTRNGAPVIAMPNPGYALHAFSTGDAYVAVAQDEAKPGARIAIFALKGGKPVTAFATHAAYALAFSPGGARLASGGWDTVTFWNPRTGSRLGALHGFGRYVSGIAFSPDGKLLAVATDWGTLQIWDLRHRKRLYAVALDGAYPALAFSPNGRLVAAGVYGTGTVWLIDVRSGKVLDHKKVSDLGCGAVAFSPDGRYLITPSTGGLITWPLDVGGTIRVFRIAGAPSRSRASSR